MKVIVVSGARSNVGKTRLSRALCKLLPTAVRVKIGHHAWKPGGDRFLYPMGTSFSVIAAQHSATRFLIIESNTILDEITPECTIYLPADNPKPSAAKAMEKADIIRGEAVPPSKIALLAERMECDEAVIRAIAELSGGCVIPCLRRDRTVEQALGKGLAAAWTLQNSFEAVPPGVKRQKAMRSST